MKIYQRSNCRFSRFSSDIHYPAGVYRRFDQELFLLATSQVDGLHDEGIAFWAVAGQLNIGLVVLFEKGRGEVSNAERDLQGGADGRQVGLLSFLSHQKVTI